MNRLSKIFLFLIIILSIALVIMTYYFFYWREGYLKAANELVKFTDAIHSAGYEILVENDGETFKLEEKVEK